MILDNALEFGEVDIPAGQINPNGTSQKTAPTVIDMSVARDVAQGGILVAQFEVTETFTALNGVPKLSMAIIATDNPTIGLAPAFYVARAGGPFAINDHEAPYLIAGNLTKGTLIHVPLAPLSRPITSQTTYDADGRPAFMQRYLGALYGQPAFTGSNFGAGKIKARLLLNAGASASPSGIPATEGIYPSNFKP